MILDYLISNTHFIIAVISFIAWLIRLESVVKMHSKEIAEINDKQSSLVTHIEELLTKIANKQEEQNIKLHSLQLDVAKIIAFEEGRRSVLMEKLNVDKK